MKPFGRQRRSIIRTGLGAAASMALASLPTSALARSAAGGGPRAEPGILPGTPLAIGDVRDGSALLWSRADRPARMTVRWATSESMRDARILPPVHALADSDLTARISIDGLPSDQRIFYTVAFEDLSTLRPIGPATQGSFRTPSARRRDVRFVWSGDNVGQGWGINPDLGGMRIYETMRRAEPEFFIHSGDTIYADGPLEERVTLADGRVWRNLVTAEKSKVAETLDEFRGQYRYNLLDDNLRRFQAEVPIFAQWDDHEVTNNWYREMRRDDDARYREGSVALLAARGMRAFQDYMPVRRHPLDPERIFDRFPWGPSLELFRIDLRSYRGPNSDAQPLELTPEMRILGARQLEWLKAALADSTATWKVIASDMPIGLIIHHDFAARSGAEGIALRDGPAAGRELEIAELLTFIRDQDIRNVVWLTADVHYTAAHHYDPARAQYRDFAPFWEFVSGPLNAGTFGPGRLDDTFGPRAVFQKTPEPGRANLSPLDGMQFFGQVDIDGETEALTVRLKDLEGATLFEQLLTPERSA